MSGGWQRSFTLAESTEVTFSLKYYLTQSATYESDEFSQALVSVDGVLYGNGPNDYLAQLVGDVNGGSPITTGWQTFELTAGTLSAGTHTLAIGAYNNKKTAADETTELRIDDVVGVALDSNGDIHLSVTNPFAVAGVAGDDEDAFTFLPTQLGADTTGTYASTLLFDGSQFGLALTAINGMDLPVIAAAGLTITESGGSTDVTEGGPADSYVVVLDSIPTASVDVTVTPDSQADLGAGDGTAIVLTFTPVNALTPQLVNVAAEDDAVVEGAHTSTITHAAASSDTNYNGIAINNVVANITDNDTPSVTIAESGGTTDVTEGGVADSYTVVLNTIPTASVNVTVTPDSQTDLGAGAGTAIVLTFTTANALTPQPVNVTAVDDAIAEGAHTSTITHAATSSDTNYNGIAINNVVANITDNDASAETIVYLSFYNAATLPGGLAVENEDIVAFDGTDFSLFLDGSDVGLTGTSVDAFAVISGNEILLSFRSSEIVPGIGVTVADSDIVKFTATQLGDTTSGTLEMFFRGFDLGLSSTAKDVDAVDLHADGRLIVSTIGNVTMAGVSGSDEDLIAFTPDVPGDYTSGTWEMYFDGSDVGLSGEDVYAVAVDANGDIHLSTTNNFAVTGVSGDDEDVFTFVPSLLGVNTAGTYVSALLFDGSEFGLAASDANGIDLPTPAAAGAPMATLDTNGDGGVTAIDALMIINHLSSQDATQTEGEAAAQRSDRTTRNYDSNGDGRVSALDALKVINYLSSAQNTVTPRLDAIHSDPATAIDDDLIRMLADDQLTANQLSANR